MIAAFTYAVAVIFPLLVTGLAVPLAFGVVLAVMDIIWPDNFSA